MTSDMFEQVMKMISQEAVKMSEASDGKTGPGGCAAAIMSTLIAGWADAYGPHWESVIDETVAVAKDTLLRQRTEQAN
jgi:hypothetical protein